MSQSHSLASEEMERICLTFWKMYLHYPVTPKGLGGVDMPAKYRCTVCGYIYDPELGDPDGSIQPGTPFEEIPDDWVCPVCGAAKSDFERIE